MEKTNLPALPTFSLKDALISGCAGGSAGLTVDLVLFPMDALKTRIQAVASRSSYQALFDTKVPIYKGFTSAAMASFPCAGVFFLVYDFSKYFWSTHCELISSELVPSLSLALSQAISSATAETTQALVRNPFEVVKQNLQAARYSTAQEAISQIFKFRGLRGFYAGYSSLVMRQIPFSAIQFPLYEFIKRSHLSYLAKKTGQSAQDIKMSFLRHCMNGSIAGGISAFVTTPIDVIKTKLMTANMQERASSISEAFRKVYGQRGASGLFAGAWMRVFYISIGGAVFFTMYEQMRRVLYRSLN